MSDEIDEIRKLYEAATRELPDPKTTNGFAYGHAREDQADAIATMENLSGRMVGTLLEEIDRDKGKEFKVTVQTPDGPRERHYVDVLEISKKLKQQVLMSLKTPERLAAREARKAERERITNPGGLRIGYAFWGFLGDHKVAEDGTRLSTPDGNATYSWSIVYEAMRRGHAVIPMMTDRDEPGARELGTDNFKAFAGPYRVEAYRHLCTNRHILNSTREFPELDVLLLEWRFPIPGRNTGIHRTHPDYQPDLDRQTELLEHYSKTDTKIVVWDLDYKLTEEDEARLQELGVSCIIETSVAPRSRLITRRSVEPPTVVDLLMEHPTDGKATVLLSYIGSRYERDDVIDEWIRPIANRDGVRGLIHFHGNWLKDLKEIQIRWPGVVFHDRITTSDFHQVYRKAAAVPLLAKQEYLERGFVTPRIWEALQFGTVPIGFKSHLGIGRYTSLVAHDAEQLRSFAERIMGLSPTERDELRRQCVEMISFMDVKYFMNVLEGVV